MKQLFSILLCVMLVVCTGMIVVSAAEGDSADVTVTITDAKGAIAVAAEKITVADIDSDDVLTVNDVLYAAHEKFYTGGAAAGYATSVTQYGLGITKLWGDTSGSYGYYVNNNSAWSLADPVAAGDYVAAFVYTDATNWSDHYSYFDRFAGDVNAGEAITLTYSEAGYDADWNPVTLPVAGAVITVDGKETTFTTDAEGKVSLTLSENGTHLVSAKVNGKLLIAPVFLASVTGGADPVDITPNPSSVGTGESSAELYTAVCGMMLAFAAVMILRKKYAK